MNPTFTMIAPGAAEGGPKVGDVPRQFKEFPLPSG